MFFNDKFESLIVSSLHKSGPLDEARLRSITGQRPEELRRYLADLENEGLLAHVKGTTWRLSHELSAELSVESANASPVPADDEDPDELPDDDPDLIAEMADEGDEDSNDSVANDSVEPAPAPIMKTASVQQPPKPSRSEQMKKLWADRKAGTSPPRKAKNALKEIAPPPAPAPVEPPAPQSYTVPPIADLIRASIDTAKSRGATAVTLTMDALAQLLA